MQARKREKASKLLIYNDIMVRPRFGTGLVGY